MSNSLPRCAPAALCALALICLTLAARPPATWAQPGDLARGLAAELGVVGELGEPDHGYGHADALRCRLRPQDEVWVIGTRHLNWPCYEADPTALKFWRWDCDKDNWTKVPAREFFDSDSSQVVTLLYVHGNRIDSRRAVDLGWYAYDAIVADGDDPQPVRFVIWTWPSTRIQGDQLNDLRFKAARTDAEAYYLGWVLTQIRDDVPVSLMGFSYGARVITGALHMAAGGWLDGERLPTQSLGPRRFRSVLLAGALHNYWLTPGCYHGDALNVTDRMLILANSRDDVLRRYHWVFRRGKPKALGVNGLAWYDETGLVAEYDCCPCVGETHSSLLYLDAPALARMSRKYVLWHDVGQRAK